MKMSVEVIKESDFLWYDVGTFAQNYLKLVQKMKKNIESIQQFLLSKKLIRFENARFI